MFKLFSVHCTGIVLESCHLERDAILGSRLFGESSTCSVKMSFRKVMIFLGCIPYVLSRHLTLLRELRILFNISLSSFSVKSSIFFSSISANEYVAIFDKGFPNLPSPGPRFVNPSGMIDRLLGCVAIVTFNTLPQYCCPLNIETACKIKKKHIKKRFLQM